VSACALRVVAAPLTAAPLTVALLAATMLAACSDDERTRQPEPQAPPMACEPGEERACYPGPDGTEDVGVCEAGRQRCDAYGRGYGPCEDAVLPGPEDCSTPSDDNCDGLPTCAETVSSWRFGADRDETVMRIAIDESGSRYLMGYYRNAFDLGDDTLPALNGTRDVYVVKVTSGDEVAWTRTFNSTSSVSPRGIAVAQDGRVGLCLGVRGSIESEGMDPLTGAGGDDVMVAVLGPDGALMWTHRFGDDAGQRPEALAFASDGSLAVAGGAAGEFDVGAQFVVSTDVEPDAFLVVYDVQGEPVTMRLFAGADGQRPRDIAIGEDGSIVMVGEAFGTVDFGGGELVSAGSADAFVAVFDPSGAHRFSTLWGDPADDRAFGVAIDSAGELVVAGRFEGDIRIGPTLHEASGGSAFVAKLSPDGHIAWSVAPGGADGGAYDVAVDSRDRAVAVGYYDHALDFGASKLPPGGVREPQILVFKLEPNGLPVWARGISVQGNQDVADAFRAFRVLALGHDDRIHVGGYVEGAVDFGDDQEHEDTGGSDAFLWTLEP
jgi:hypothetical protein